MSLVFFVSSMGDTNLAVAAINELSKQQNAETIFLVPLTTIAIERSKDIKLPQLKIISITDIAEDALNAKTVSADQLREISAFIARNDIQHAYIGVPSPTDEEVPFQIAHSLQIPYALAYEYLFTAPKTHSYWQYLPFLAMQTNSMFAVAATAAQDEILAVNAKANVSIIGHLGIDSALKPVIVDPAPARMALNIDEKSEFTFISGTTQPVQVDNQFLNALLKEVKNFPNMQIRFGLHPGIKDVAGYIDTLLQTCMQYPDVHTQFKLVVPSKHKALLESKITYAKQFVLFSDVSGSDMAKAADRIGQAVPGALTTEAALKGKPSYFHDASVKSYLPKSLFADSLAGFFTAKPRVAVTQQELELKDEAPKLLAKIVG